MIIIQTFFVKKGNLYFKLDGQWGQAKNHLYG